MDNSQWEYGSTVEWLLAHETPGVRYLALRDLVHLPADDPDLLEARRAAHTRGPLASILANIDPAGFWEKPGPGYGPKYRSTVWAMLLLAQLGGSIDEDERVAQACRYYIEHSFTPTGHITYNGAPGGNFDCLQGNLSWSLLALGYAEPGGWDPRLDTAFDWAARTVTGEGVAPQNDKTTTERYYAYKCGPDFACGANNGQPCAWGAVKIMLAFSRLPAERRTPRIDSAIQRGVDFMFSVDPVTAAYPTPGGIPPSRNWWKFGFPLFYITDLLQLAEALVGLGYATDPRLAGTLELIRSKADDQGRWPLEYNYGSKTWGNYGRMNAPNPWVTIRALRVLSALEVVS